MQSISKVSKILILISVLLLCAVVAYITFNMTREIKTNNQEKQAGQFLEENNQAFEKAKIAEN
ncbi:hypothetical protein KAJ61_00155, partial [Candidatus Parcubacteria bacterium]|nr:hypothetical protein [Candidatus Parcubacteria bacterium]